MKHTQSLRRFASAEIDPTRTSPLPEGHAALSEGRTIYKATVTASRESPRFLVSGHNNPKLGKAVTKGPRRGWPIYHLAMEERATCPRSCLQWDSCYGNSMPFSRRHTPDADFERFLTAEIITVARQHPDGLLVRLHSLGDFYSVEYVYLWAALLAEFPQLHVFGYTAHCTDDGDDDSRRIARALQVVTDGAWERFAIRTSGGVEARSTTLVVDTEAEAAEMSANGIIMCPAQTKATEACATCGLCWAEGARDKAIGFLRHGRKLATGPRKPKTAAPDDRSELAQKLAGLGRVTVDHAPPPTPFEPLPPGPRSAQLLAFLKAETSRQGTAIDGLATASLKEIAAGSGVPMGSLGFAIYELEKRGLVHVTPGRGKRKTVYRLAAGERVSQGTRAALPAAPLPKGSSLSRRGGRTVFVEGASEPVDLATDDTSFKHRVINVPVTGTPKSATRFLMGDPPPGRTPWATA